MDRPRTPIIPTTMSDNPNGVANDFVELSLLVALPHYSLSSSTAMDVILRLQPNTPQDPRHSMWYESMAQTIKKVIEARQELIQELAVLRRDCVHAGDTLRLYPAENVSGAQGRRTVEACLSEFEHTVWVLQGAIGFEPTISTAIAEIQDLTFRVKEFTAQMLSSASLIARYKVNCVPLVQSALTNMLVQAVTFAVFLIDGRSRSQFGTHWRIPELILVTRMSQCRSSLKM